MRRFVLFICIAQLFAAIVSKDFTCDPTTDCLAATAGDKVPDKDDCQKYYVCLDNGNPSPTSFVCDRGEYFDTTVQTPRCSRLLNQCVINFCSSINTCSLDCNTASFIPVAGDCNKFYDCNDPSQTQVECPAERPYFDGFACVSDASQCCSVCAYQCDITGYTTVPDPKNCNGYYLCNNGNYQQSFCPEGEYYDVLLKHCVEEITPCVSYCSTSSTTSVPTTTTTSTPTTTTTTPAITTTTANCYNDFQCPADGEFVYCDACISQHYVCDGGTADLTDCARGEVFDYTISACVAEDDCPTFSLDYIMS